MMRVQDTLSTGALATPPRLPLFSADDPVVASLHGGDHLADCKPDSAGERCVPIAPVSSAAVRGRVLRAGCQLCQPKYFMLQLTSLVNVRCIAVTVGSKMPSRADAEAGQR
jgi:hypothetical protein